MKQQIVQLTDVTTKTITEMAMALMPVSPRLVFSGTDQSGNKRHAEITLDDFLDLPNQKARADFMAKTGTYAASFSPYIVNVEEIYIAQKRIVDLRKAGYEKEEAVLVISGIDIPQAQKGTHAYVMLINQGSLGLKHVDMGHIDGGIEHSQIYEEMQVFLDSYAKAESGSKKGKS